jgi:hypothetical protein
MSLFSFDQKRHHVAVWKCPLCPFACEQWCSVRSHLMHYHHLTPEDADTARRQSRGEYRDMPAKRHYVCSPLRYKNHEPEKNSPV